MIAVPQQGKDIPHSAGPARTAADNASQAFLASMGSLLYRHAYILGMHTIRAFKRSGRRIARLFRPVKRWVSRKADRVLWQQCRAASAECKRFAAGFPVAADRVRTAWRQHPLKAVGQVLALPVLAFRRHRRAFGRIANIAAPAGALAVLALTVQFWAGQHFALALEVDGQQVGYIQDESVLDAASAMAEGRVQGGTFEWEHSPRLAIAIADEETIMSEEDLCNELLRMSSDAVAQMYGLYIDGEFEGATVSRDGLEQALQAVKDTYTGDEEATVSFLQAVEIREALYPVISVRTGSAMVTHLLSDKTVQGTHAVQEGDTFDTVAKRYGITEDELRALNPAVDAPAPGVVLDVVYIAPRIQVQVEREETYTQEIAYSKVTKESAELYVGQEKVTGGEKGEKTVTAKVVFVNGEEVSRQVMSETVSKEPVEMVILVGTKTLSGTPDQNKGSFIWPVPVCQNISRGLSYGHHGLDICNGPVTVNNQPFVAAAGGTVIEASYGWNGGYGNMVRIDHGNGYTSYYAHCNTLSVTVGQKVNAGDMLGLIGNTGDSDGPHLHFEIRYNGNPVNPYQFF